MDDKTAILARRIDQAMGREPADLVIKGARYLNVIDGAMVAGDIAVTGDTIVGVQADYHGVREMDGRGKVVVPGFIDTHVHVESTCISPWEFDRVVLERGTTTAICDPHEISNVLGTKGLDYFLAAAANLAMDLRVQLSSCVPASHLETSGAVITAADLAPYKDHPRGIGLAEFMNYPGVLNKEPAVLEKLSTFLGGHIDGHVPMVSGRDLNAYCACGIKNCHESTSLKEAAEKLSKGMQVLIRDGSLCKDVVTLSPLINDLTSPFLALCTDDRNPLDIAEEGHLDHLIRSAIGAGAPMGAVYRTASWSAAQGFGLRDRGLIAPGYRADMVLLDDLADCAVASVIRDGRPVDDESFGGHRPDLSVGRRSIKLDRVEPSIFEVPGIGPSGPVIGLVPDGVITTHLTMDLPFANGLRHPDPENDVLKVVVLNRHGGNRNIGRGFIKGFGFRDAAIASSVGHDAHNVIVVGDNDRDMAVAVNRLIEIEGGFAVVRGGRVIADLPLPIAGLMSDKSAADVVIALQRLRLAAKDIGCPLPEPFLHMAFLPLCVIPHLKITDHGLVDVDKFELIAA
ncbi:MAG: adenine deaminase [Alphaproteobacteria bacterium]